MMRLENSSISLLHKANLFLNRVLPKSYRALLFLKKRLPMVRKSWLQNALKLSVRKKEPPRRCCSDACASAILEQHVLSISSNNAVFLDLKMERVIVKILSTLTAYKIRFFFPWWKKFFPPTEPFTSLGT